jgi:hypothetical protein
MQADDEQHRNAAVPLRLARPHLPPAKYTGTAMKFRRRAARAPNDAPDRVLPHSRVVGNDDNTVADPDTEM